MSDFSSRLNALSPEKRALYERMLRERKQSAGKSGGRAQAIPARERANTAPLSLAQQRLFFLNRWQPDTAAYNVTAGWRFSGKLDRDALSRAFAEIVRRHDVLRSRYVMKEDQPVQRIAPAGGFKLSLFELSAVPAGEREREALRIAGEEAQTPFSLAQGPLFRVAVIRLAHEDHLVVVNTHHIVSDGWSINVLLREFEQLYAAYSSNQASPLADLSIQYSDFAVWQRETKQERELDVQMEYWRNQLAGVADTTLPTDYPRPRMQTSNGAKVFRRLPVKLRRDLKGISEARGATLFVTLLAAFNVLLSRWIGRDDLVVGSPIGGRNYTELEPLIGFFVNTLPFRSRVSGDALFTDLIAQVRETVLEVHSNQDVPFERLVDELKLERSLSHTPLFQIGFSLNAPVAQPKLPGLSCRMIEVDTATAKFDLTLEMIEQDDGVFCALEYNTDLFRRDTAERILRQYECLLRSIAENPNERIGRLRLLDNEERRQVLDVFAGHASEYERDQCIHELFEQQAAERPARVALVFGSEEITYGELNASADKLAGYLRGLGVGPDQSVGVSLERSPEMIVACLAILKAGGAYVPLDAAYPDERLRFMLEDTAARWVLTNRKLARRVQVPGVEAIVLEDVPDTAAPLEKKIAVGPGSLAYIIYTSGSTGRPKGVCAPHRAVVRLVRGTDYMHFGTEEVFLQFAPVSFDAATLEIWGSLLNGGRLVLFQGQDTSLRALGQTIQKYGITSLWATTGLFRVMVDEQLDSLRGLRQLLTGGEVMPLAQAERALRELPDCRVINFYGPTENTTFTTAYTMERERIGRWTSMPIGKPIANTRVYILDEQRAPVPIGVPGELYTAGDGLAVGYWNRPELTAEKFVEDPFHPGERMYGTGDLARWLPDGNIEFLGRIDAQVKIRGFRVEPGEVEAVLAGHPAVEACTVVVQRDAKGSPRLIGYVVGPTETADLKQYLQQRLPEYMLPGGYVNLSELPLTPNGKVDRRALPEWEPAAEARSVAPQSEPQGEIERQIAAVWQEALSVEKVGLDDNFFELGGHSLLLIQVHSKLQRELKEDLAIVDLFRCPTVRTLAEYVSGSAVVPELKAEETKPQTREPIAIVAMAGRFPGAQSVEELWANLRAGVESIRTFTEEELRAAGVDEAEFRQPNYVKAGTTLEGADLFDAQYFGFNPREAEITDPQHRLFLECAHEALERGGCDPWRYAGRIGVFAGSTVSTYRDNLQNNAEVRQSSGPLQLLIGNDKDFVPTRVAYKLNLRGPAVNVQTACSTSLVAVHMACESLLRNECEMALAGGVSIRFPQPGGYPYQEESIMSPDGHCRAFDEQAQGTVGGNGVGIVLLKRLSAALADGDPIEAVIAGSAINNDGARKVGYTAPGVEGQAAVIRAAQAAAGVKPDEISFIEAHGTGTNLGDPIEIAALKQVFGRDSEKRVALASVKSNLGHLDAAAGVTGLIKTALQLKHGEIAASLHFTKPNSKLGLEESPFFVNTELRPWERNGAPRRAGVSSFGIGGTNAHVVLAEAPEREPSAAAKSWQVLPLSAKTESALEQLSTDVGSFCDSNPTVNLADLAYTLQLGRTQHSFRRAVVCDSNPSTGRSVQGECVGAVPSVLYLFPGQGAQYPGMGRAFYDTKPIFREELDRCAELLRLNECDLLPLLFSEDAKRLRQTRFTQPALFAVEYALARQWMSWGVPPCGMIGHSIGEYVAACLAGVFELGDAIRLVALRGRLMDELPRGTMLAVPLPEGEALSVGRGRVSLAAVNGPRLCVLSGTEAAVAEIEEELVRGGIEGWRLHTSHAFHSDMMDPVLADFAQAAGAIRRNAPQFPWVSNVTGTWITPGEATDPQYWARHLRSTVRFADGVATLLQQPNPLFLEVGPGATLGGLVRAAAATEENRRPRVAACMPGPKRERPEEEQLAAALAECWVAGCAVDWKAVHGDERRMRVAVPTYPFERQKFWIPATPTEAKRTTGKQPFDSWFSVPSWERASRLPKQPAVTGSWLVFANEPSDVEGIWVRRGTAFSRISDGEYTIRTDVREDYSALFRDLKNSNRLPERIAAIGGNFRSLLYLVQAVAKFSVELAIVTQGALDVTGEEDLSPESAALLGLSKSIPLDLPRVRCRFIDADGRTDRITAELLAGSEAVVALRGRERWTPVYKPITARGQKVQLREGGVFLITGGFGGVGLELARYLAQIQKSKLVLLGRSEAPQESVRALEELGADVLTIQADVCDATQMRRAISRAEGHFGALDGVIHAAGLQVTKPIGEISLEECETQFRPKREGLHSLEGALGDRRLEFCVIVSSLASVLGVRGFGAYAAAHTFADTFTARHNRTSASPWICVNLDNWLTGASDEALPQNAPAYLMRRQEGLQAFERILAEREESRIVVSTGDIETRFKEIAQPASAGKDVSNAAPRHARPQLKTTYAAPRNEAEQKLTAIWQRLLGIAELGVHDNFFELGGDSVMSIQIVARANEAGLRLSSKQVFKHQTIAELAAVADVSAPAGSEIAIVEGKAPLSPIQRWFFDMNPAEPHYFNQALLFQVDPATDGRLVERALQHLVAHHDALRLKFSHGTEGWEQFNVRTAAPVRFNRVDLSSIADRDRSAHVEQIAGELQRSLDLEQPSLLNAAQFDFGAGMAGRLLFVVHHLAVDLISWRILMEDLETAYSQLARGESVRLPGKTTSFRDWTRLLEEAASSAFFAKEIDYWTTPARRSVAKLPRDYDGFGNGPESSALIASGELGIEETRALLHDVPPVYRTRINDVLLAALTQVLCRWTGTTSMLVDLEGLGREPVLEHGDVSRTVGWFTAVYPVMLELDASDHGGLLVSVKEQLRRVPSHGIGYGVLRYLDVPGGVSALMRDLPRPEVSFLYQGQSEMAAETSGILRGLASEGTGAPHSPGLELAHLLAVHGCVVNGRLRFDWVYSSRNYNRETIARLAREYVDALRELIRHCQSPEAGGFTASDFKAAKMSARDFDLLFGRMQKQKAAKQSV